MYLPSTKDIRNLIVGISVTLLKSVVIMALVFVTGSTFAQSRNMSKDEIIKNLNFDGGSLDFLEIQTQPERAMAQLALNGRCQSFNDDGSVDETFDLEWDESTNEVKMSGDNGTMPCYTVDDEYNLYCDADADKNTAEHGVFIDVGEHRLFTKVSELSKGENATIYGVAAEGMSVFEEDKELFCVGFIKNVSK